MPFEIDDSIFDRLAEILKKHELKEIEYQQGDVKIRILAKQEIEPERAVCVSRVVGTSPPLPDDPQPSDKPPQTNQVNFATHEGAMKSPMVGTCYLAPEPGAADFVSVGDIVQEGQPVLIIEAMKVMNMMKAQRPGKIIHIAVKSGEPIEYGQLLLVIE
ncbi:MAG: acetyl-CoA carboxylase, biotin carboxyl carrier protein [Holosporales bacterium]|nr:acetyl-CoA carboxylase, biotin carboxyl carrier protein [Holosporales bacterium]